METVAVLQCEPDLGAAVPAAERQTAARLCVARALTIPRGAWDGTCGEGGPNNPSGFGLLVLSGILCRRVPQSDHCGAELVGPGDLLRPWDRISEWTSIPSESSWTVIEESRVAVLDAHFSQRAAPFPGIAEALVRRALLRSRYLAIQIAIFSQRRVETRLTMLFWHLADRFGRVGADWVQVPVPLTHGLLGELIGARRPSVTTALSALNERGILTRHGNGWRLSGTVPPEYEVFRGVAAEALLGAR